MLPYYYPVNGLTDIPGIRVGHASNFDALTGCTVILCERGAVAGADIRGSATGTQEFDVLSPGHIAPHIHAVTFAGRSAFGLESAAGVRNYLAARGVGFATAGGPVPIVPCAILYDLALGKPDVRPTREMGASAAEAASTGPVKEGSVGAGTGATVGKLFGIKRAMKGGVGTFTVELEGRYAGVKVSALAVVNALGDVRDPATGNLVAGARVAEDSRELANAERAMKRGATGGFDGGNTTLAVVATNARLTKLQATKLAQLGQLGMARTIYPVHTMSDGDIVIALSSGEANADINALGVAAAEAVAQSVLRGVRSAVTLGGVPGLSGNL